MIARLINTLIILPPGPSDQLVHMDLVLWDQCMAPGVLIQWPQAPKLGPVHKVVVALCIMVPHHQCKTHDGSNTSLDQYMDVTTRALPIP